MSKSNADQDWCVYIVRCSDGSLYTGCTNALDQRIKAHNQGNGAKYTRGRMPVKLVYQEKNYSHSEALQREHEIKQLSRQNKIELIETQALT